MLNRALFSKLLNVVKSGLKDSVIDASITRIIPTMKTKFLKHSAGSPVNSNSQVYPAGSPMLNATLNTTTSTTPTIADLLATGGTLKSILAKVASDANNLAKGVRGFSFTEIESGISGLASDISSIVNAIDTMETDGSSIISGGIPGILNEAGSTIGSTLQQIESGFQNVVTDGKSLFSVAENGVKQVIGAVSNL